MAISCKKTLSYPISLLKNTVNGISDAFLSGLWLTGVTIGLVDRSANKIKKSIIGSKKKPEPPAVERLRMVIKPTEEKDQALLNLLENAKGFEKKLTKFEQSVANLEKRVKGR